MIMYLVANSSGPCSTLSVFNAPKVLATCSPLLPWYTACIPEHTSRKRSRGTRKGGGERAAGENPESVARWADSISRKKGAACGKYFGCIKYRKGWTWTTGISNKIRNHLDENSFEGVVVAKAWLDEFKDVRREQYYRECRKYFEKFT